MEFELIIPNGWDCFTLKELTTKIGSGATPDGGNSSYKSEGIALVRSMNVYDIGFKNEGLAFIDETQANKLSNVVLQSKDVLLNITGASIARCCIVPELALPGRVNQHVAILRAIEKKILPEFLHLFLISPKQKNRLLNISGGGATREALTKKMIEEIQIPLPPLPEQTRIVAKLDALFERIDKAIALLEGNIKRTGELMGAILGEVFGELEKSPQKTLKHLCDKLTDGTHFSPKQQFTQHQEGLFKYVTSKNIRWSGLDLENLTYVTKEIHEDIYKRCNPEFGDLLFTKDGAMTGTCCINTLTEPFSLLSSVALVKPNKKLVSSKFLYFFFKSPQGRDRIFQDISGAAITRTTVAKLNLVQIPVIDLTRQNEIVQYLEKCEELTTALVRSKTQKLHHLQALKSSLLDQAFRGEL